jgi:deazaflavin-dependent oxidoreductase (nitroreductase family)
VGWRGGTRIGPVPETDADRRPPDDDYCYLTTTGRLTGRPHRIEIWYVLEGGTVYLLAGAGRRSDWVKNLVAAPAVLVEVDGTIHGARGRPLDGEGDGDEAELARSLVHAKYAPRSGGDLTGWRDSALPVALDLTR